MKSLLSLVLVALFATFMLTACVVAPVSPGYEVAPPLPAVIELDVAQPYYYQSGYHYFYQNDRWHYSKAKNGPWTELPRSHWPKEIRRRGREEREERGREFRREHEGR